MSQYLPVNPEAAAVHEVGLNLALSGDFGAAHEKFAEALGHLGQLSLETLIAGSADTVQQARIKRDDGFTIVREALVDGVDQNERAAKFRKALARLGDSANMTLPYVGGIERPIVGRPANFRSKHQRREVIGEHGMTIGLLGEAVVAQQVALHWIEPYGKVSPESRAVQYQIGTGYDLAKGGPNQYYPARIALIAMRTERINGRPLNVLPWLGRYAACFGRALLRDWSDLPDVVRQAGKIPREIATRKRAFAATTNWRTV